MATQQNTPQESPFWERAKELARRQLSTMYTPEDYPITLEATLAPVVNQIQVETQARQARAVKAASQRAPFTKTHGKGFDPSCPACRVHRKQEQARLTEMLAADATDMALFAAELNGRLFWQNDQRPDHLNIPLAQIGGSPNA